jgi:hypothetical protein
MAKIGEARSTDVDLDEKDAKLVAGRINWMKVTILGKL